MCGFGWLAFFWLESSRPHYPAPASLFVQHVTPFRHNKWGDCWGPGPRGKRPCISVINLLVPTLRQQEIADFSSFTLGQRTHSTQQVCIQNQLELIDSLWFNCRIHQRLTFTALPSISSVLYNKEAVCLPVFQVRSFVRDKCANVCETDINLCSKYKWLNIWFHSNKCYFKENFWGIGYSYLHTRRTCSVWHPWDRPPSNPSLPPRKPYHRISDIKNRPTYIHKH